MRPIAWRRRLRWVLLAFVPSSLVLGVTTYITTDLAAVPLLWVIPLSLYLLSFVVVFARRRVIPGVARGACAAGCGRAARARLPLGRDRAGVVPHPLPPPLSLLRGAGLPRPARRRPPRRLAPRGVLSLPRRSGGALGGLFNALVAPLVFDTVVEYPLVILLASYLRPGFRRERGRLLGLRLGARAREESADSDEAEEERPGALDFLLPLLIGLLAAALLLVVNALRADERSSAWRSRSASRSSCSTTSSRRARCASRSASARSCSPSCLFSEHEGRDAPRRAQLLRDAPRPRRRVADTLHWLRHGSTLHGKQYTDPGEGLRADSPTTTARGRSARSSRRCTRGRRRPM